MGGVSPQNKNAGGDDSPQSENAMRSLSPQHVDAVMINSPEHHAAPDNNEEIGDPSNEPEFPKSNGIIGYHIGDSGKGESNKKLKKKSNRKNACSPASESEKSLHIDGTYHSEASDNLPAKTRSAEKNHSHSSDASDESQLVTPAENFVTAMTSTPSAPSSAESTVIN